MPATHLFSYSSLSSLWLSSLVARSWHPVDTMVKPHVVVLFVARCWNTDLYKQYSSLVRDNIVDSFFLSFFLFSGAVSMSRPHFGCLSYSF